MTQRLFDSTAFIAKSEELLADKDLNQALMDSFPWPAMLIRKDRRIITANKAAIEIGVEVGSFCWETFGGKKSITEDDRDYYEKNNAIPLNGIKCTFCKANEALASKKPVNEKIPAGDITYDTYWIPLIEDVYLHYAVLLP